MDSESEINDYIQLEEELIEEYVKSSPYPQYEDIIKILYYNLTFLDMYAEYGELNHTWCKTIYNNPNNKKLIVEMGKNIYNRGGMQALVQNHQVLRLIYSKSNNIIIKGYVRIIEEYFQDVCDEWVA